MSNLEEQIKNRYEKSKQVVVEVLQDLGINFTKDGDGFRTNGFYRGGNNKTSIKIFPNGRWVDFAEGKKGYLDDLIGLALGYTSLDQVNEWIQNKQYDFSVLDIARSNTRIFMPKKIDYSFIESLEKDYSYFNQRGISDKTLDLFECGVCRSGMMKNRFCFPVFNSKKNVIGVVGRSLNDNDKIKVKIKGIKKDFVFPAFLNHKTLVEKKEVIIVEGIPDLLSLYECGINNVLCLFGVDMGLGLLNYLLKITPRRIIIATNSDDAGSRAAYALCSRMSKYFPKQTAAIFQPLKRKDFNEMLVLDGKESILHWQSCL